MEFDPELIIPDRNLSLGEGAVAPWRHPGKGLAENYERRIREYCDRFPVNDAVPYRNLSPQAARILLHGTTDEEARTFGFEFEGVVPDLKRRWQTTESESARRRLYEFLAEAPCPACGGARLNREALCVHIDGRTIADVTRMTVAQAQAFLGAVSLSPEASVVAAPLITAIHSCLKFMIQAGVDYLTLDRPAQTLSGGEWQRIRLATQIGGGLSGVCYVLDEPTVGLHPRDSRRLVDILRRLAEMGNTVLVVEHDPEVIHGASYMIEIGPGAGPRGGHVVAQGPIEEVLRSDASVTGKYVTGRLSIPIPPERRAVDWTRCLQLTGVTAHNLQDISVRFPLGRMVAVTGVSGSGKSTLVLDVLLRALRRSLAGGGPKPAEHRILLGGELVNKVVEVDQAPIGRTPRSIPATYVGTFGPIRELYAQTREAKIRGYGPNRFSFNVKGGRCEHCEGQGVRRITLHFLPDVYVTCSQCRGTRYNRETLDIRYRGKSIADVLNMGIDEAAGFFENFPRIRERLAALKDVGLGYLTLGQSSTTLSGGEAQRIKLASELHKSADGHTVYFLDEPTTGLHFTDVRNLLGVLNRLVDRGQSVIVIEHNLEVIKSADWVIDLGPEGGENGGQVIVEGTPEEVANHTGSHTGQFLRRFLEL
jgi:excinuclease ABC subunit A